LLLNVPTKLSLPLQVVAVGALYVYSFKFFRKLKSNYFTTVYDYRQQNITVFVLFWL